MIFKNLHLNGRERKTFRLHLSYSLIEGIIAGLLILNEFVFLKSIKGSPFQLSFLFQFSALVLIVSIFTNEFLRRIKNKKKLLRVTSLITRLPLFLLLFFPRNAASVQGSEIYHYIFLSIFFVFYLSSPIIFPLINLFLKSNYRHEKFGMLYSYSTTLNKIVMLVVTFLFGMLLDFDNFAFVYIYPIMGFLGMVSVFLLSKINYRVSEEVHVTKPFMTSIKESIKKMRTTIKSNKPFKDFEIGFNLYGFAFMSTTTVITIFYEKELMLNYTSVAFYKNVYNILAIAILPFFGRLLGKIDPRKFAAITFGSLLLYLLFLGLTEFFPFYSEIWGVKVYYMLMIGIVFHGVFAATMSLLWSIGSAYFCKKEDAADYQAIHLTQTGVRAVFAPMLGVLFFSLVGYSGTFGIAILSLLLAIIWMIKSYKQKIIVDSANKSIIEI